MKLTIKFLLSAIVAMGFSVISFAQITTSSLGGQITESSGVPAVGIAVVATHQPSGTVYGAVTNAEGRYAIQGMRVGGPYSVEISSLGFQSVTYTDIILQLGEQYALNSVIKESSELLAEALVIASPTSRFSTEKTGAATNISRQQMENLPTISRSITEVTKLSPYGGNGMSFVGTDGRTANFTVDGANFNNNFGLSSSLPGGGSPISIDAIEEVQVVISPYDVRQTNFIGGGVNAITKSGTNTFRGSAYVYHRNENMRGNAVDGKDIAGARDRDRTTTYGFTLGGPIVKNKLFFFVNYEYPPLGGGGGTALSDIAEELATRHEIMVLTSGTRSLPAREMVCGVQVARAAVVAQPLPQRQHLAKVGIRQRLDGGKARHVWRHMNKITRCDRNDG